ncbi:type IV pilin N-terminal domain-containing protein [Halospeciosus flavus]|uniref:Type IV pilin N-terminal domain-containing protein n=1 Tax=Halospeciosus flavus TaxID=3032283 RepID=A0ABD5Z7U3_9EURY|nr:type IV pilin N-terminal domain-containing protein [Halospeciosus flavus]
MDTDSRALAPAVGVVVLVGVTVLLAATVGSFALAASPTPSTATPVALSMTVTGDGTVVLEHGPGPPLDVRDLRIRVRVDGEALRHQPPVPFFAARGFVSGPTGPFNVAADSTWAVGERATFRIAGSNRPSVAVGDRVVVHVVERTGRTYVLEAVVEQ